MSPPPLKHTSCDDNGTMIDALVAMHMRSEAASAPAKAQQQPQLDWSRMSPMIFAHWGQFSSESKDSGTLTSSLALNSTISPMRTCSFTAASWSPMAPHSPLDAPGGSAAKRGWAAAFQSTPGVRWICSI